MATIKSKEVSRHFSDLSDKYISLFKISKTAVYLKQILL